MKKSTIYLDAEEDITSVIEKVVAAEDKIVAVVPPKKMAILQSAVNLKLLKKSANQNKKNLVIISKDSTLKPLAGSVGIHLADTLASRPYIPETPESDSAKDISIDDDDVKLGDNTPIGLLEKTTKPKKDDEPKVEEKKKKKSDNKFLASIPNFGKFRLKLFLIIFLVIGGAVAWYVGYVVMPTASITITAQTSKTPVSVVFELKETIAEDDFENLELIPIKETSKVTLTTTVDATGRENVGEKAEGTITISNCYSSEILTIPEETLFTAAGGYEFVTLAAVNVPGAVFVGGCSTPGEATVEVISTVPGGESNLAAGTAFTTANYNGLVTGSGSKMSGGTDVFRTAVSQEDIDKAVAELETDDHDAALAELEAQFPLDVVPISATFKVKEGKPSSTPSLGEEAEEVVVNLVYTYTMKGIKLNSLSQILDDALAEEIKDTQLSVYDNGLDDITMSVSKNTVTAVTNGFTGPELDTDALAVEVSGKSVSEIRSILKAKDGVNEVTVVLEPLWVFRSPSADKITIDVVVNEHVLQ